MAGMVAQVYPVLHCMTSWNSGTVTRNIGEYVSQVRVIGMLSQPDAFASAGLLVGRLVANATFLRALTQFGTLDAIHFFIGESSEQKQMEAIQRAYGGDVEIRVSNLIDFPQALERGSLDVVHFNELNVRMPTVMHLRNRFAKKTLPVTGQIHSLSYPSSMQTYQHLIHGNPAPYDAIFCSTVAGRDVVMNCVTDLQDRLRRRGGADAPLSCALPVVPLGIDTASLQRGNRGQARTALGIPQDAFVFLSIGRFTEYDKMDLFPVVQAFASVRHRLPPSAPVYLVLAGASQGTKTAQMVALWAKALKVGPWLKMKVDFEDTEKPGLLAAADAFVSMTDNPQETYGLTVVEAMGAGLPVIVSDFNGYKDTVQDGVGIRVTTRWNTEMDYLSDLAPLLYERPLHLFLGQSVEIDLPELERAMETLYHDSALRHSMGAAALKRAKSKYDWPVVIEQYLSHWNQLMQLPRLKESGSLNVMRMSYRGAFSHYPTEWADMGRFLVRSDWSRDVAGDKNLYPVFTELRLLFSNQDVIDTLRCAEQPIQRGTLQHKITKGDQESAHWRAGMLIAWLIKHGLLVDVEKH